MTANSAPALVALRAYDAAGKVLATSTPVKPALRSGTVQRVVELQTIRWFGPLAEIPVAVLTLTRSVR